MKDIIFKLWKKIILSKNIVLINHIRMDPDAYGSLCAFYMILEKLWKKVKAINDELANDNFDFFWKKEIFETELNLKKYNPDLIISFDAASVDQLWKSYKKNKEVFDKSDFFVIDHHITNHWFWKYNIIDKDSSSTCELLYTIIKELNLEKYIDKKIATSLYTWIITDTNIFYNSCTTDRTLSVASELIKLWADFRISISEFYKKRAFNKVKLWWYILENLKSNKEKNIFWAVVKDEYFEKTNTGDKDISWLINEFLSNIEWMKLCFLIYKLKSWDIKTSFRSSIDFNVWEFCEKFWWWWHKQAAGFSISGKEESLESVEEKIIKELKKL